jgi:hypothetical protein
VAFTFLVGNSVHLDGFNELNFIHESFKGECPAISNCLEILSLVFIDFNERSSFSSSLFSLCGSAGQRFDDSVS